jgi:hypothetical protein
MITWLRVALALMDLITRIMDSAEQTHWMNEGERRLIAAQLKERNDAMAKAAGVDKEYAALTDEAVTKRIQEEGWYRD